MRMLITLGIAVVVSVAAWQVWSIIKEERPSRMEGQEILEEEIALRVEMLALCRIIEYAERSASNELRLAPELVGSIDTQLESLIEEVDELKIEGLSVTTVSMLENELKAARAEVKMLANDKLSTSRDWEIALNSVMKILSSGCTLAVITPLGSILGPGPYSARTQGGYVERSSFFERLLDGELDAKPLLRVIALVFALLGLGFTGSVYLVTQDERRREASFKVMTYLGSFLGGALFG